MGTIPHSTKVAPSILVSGATGTIGSEVLRLLTFKGTRPRAFVRDVSGAQLQLGKHVDIVKGDFDQPRTVAAALTGIDALFLLTPQDRRQVEWEQGIIDAAVMSGVRRVVKLSVFRADVSSRLQIARQHREAEAALERSGLDYTILRPVFFMQNLLAMVRGGVLPSASGDGRLAMVDGRDVAAVAARTLTSAGHVGKTYTLTGPEAVSFDDVAAVMSQKTGAAIAHLRVPANAVRSALEGAGVATWFAEDMANLHGMLAAGYEDLTTDTVRAVTGQQPRTLAQFVATSLPSSGRRRVVSVDRESASRWR